MVRHIKDAQNAMKEFQFLYKIDHPCICKSYFINIHELGLIHQDLKLENIMLNLVFEAKLIDFGFIRINESLFDENSFVNDSLTKGIDTFSYMLPEMLNEEDYDNKTDVYSFGFLLHFISIGN